MAEPASEKYLTNTQVYLLAIACGAAVANAYYVHPIVSTIETQFNLPEGQVGIVPALNQIALAVGILLLLPLGDFLSNRILTSVTAFGQFLSIAVMAFAERFEVFLIASTILGFMTIAPYLLPAYASKRVAPDRLGYVTAVLTTGVILGILLARGGAGIVAEYFGWRTVYMLGAGLMLIVSILLPLIMEPRQARAKTESKQSYFGLIGSLVPLMREKPAILTTGFIQMGNFGLFISLWMGIGLHLPSEEMGFGVDTVGYLSMLTAINLFITPMLGSWADRVGARRARFLMAMIQVVGVSLLFVTGHSLWLMIIPILLINLPGPVIDIAGRMTFLSEDPEVRTRLMTIYIVMMFIGGGLASWAGTLAYAAGGWIGNALVNAGLSALVIGLSWWSWQSGRDVDGAQSRR
ncbi:MAG: MFS transporter [Pseudomonadota bacterium]